MYITGGIILYKMVNFSTIDLQYLDGYRQAAHELINCVPSSCSQSILKDGLRYYVHWIDLFPHSMEAYNAAGYCFYHLHEYRRASAYFTDAIELDSRNPTLYYNQALTLLYLGDYPKALRVLKKGVTYFAADTFFNPYMILPFKRNLTPDLQNQPVLIYNLALFEYEGLMSLTEKIDHTSDDKQKKDLIDKLRQEIDTRELYYYVPAYINTIQGKPVVMI